MIPVPEFRVNIVTKLKSRIAEGKELKLLNGHHDKRGTLNVDKKELGRTMCPACDLKPRCIEADTVEKLTVFFLEGVFQGVKGEVNRIKGMK
jgi:hypothetical protein